MINSIDIIGLKQRIKDRAEIFADFSQHLATFAIREQVSVSEIKATFRVPDTRRILHLPEDMNSKIKVAEHKAASEKAVAIHEVFFKLLDRVFDLEQTMSPVDNPQLEGYLRIFRSEPELASTIDKFVKLEPIKEKEVAAQTTEPTRSHGLESFQVSFEHDGDVKVAALLSEIPVVEPVRAVEVPVDEDAALAAMVEDWFAAAEPSKPDLDTMLLQVNQGLEDKSGNPAHLTVVKLILESAANQSAGHA